MHQPHSGQTPSTYQPHSIHAPTTLHPHTIHTSATLHPHTSNTPITFHPHTGHSPFTHQSHFIYIPSTHQPHSIHAPVTFRPRTSTTSCTHQPHFTHTALLCSNLSVSGTGQKTEISPWRLTSTPQNTHIYISLKTDRYISQNHHWGLSDICISLLLRCLKRSKTVSSWHLQQY